MQLSGVTSIELLRVRPHHQVYRVACQDQWFVLKVFDDPAHATEVHVYSLLERCSVPTLPVYKQTEQALLIEDLAHSHTWLAAHEADQDDARTGHAVAQWYRTLHAAGLAALQSPGDMHSGGMPPAFLSEWVHEWVQVLDAPTLRAAGIVLDLKDVAGWRLAAETIERLKAAFRALPQTFNYNDFAMENLALSRDDGPVREAIVFDYDQFSIGPAYSDWRNVMGCLQGDARRAFREAYGPVNDAERLLDEPLAGLYALALSAQRPQFPSWARPLLEWVRSGEMEQSVRRALEFT